MKTLLTNLSGLKVATLVGDLFETLSTWSSGKARDPLRATALMETVEALLSRRGEASGVMLARLVLEAYADASAEEKHLFLRTLCENFGADEAALTTAIEAFREAPSPRAAARINAASEPRRREVLRRLNLAPEGTPALVRMREDVLARLREEPDLKPLDDDFAQVFASWFNRGFLTLRPIDWHTPAAVLEKIIRYEAVHVIEGWDDLRNRLAPPDRRCFAFFHPGLPDEPLIFVEVALTRSIPDAIGPLLALDRDPIAAEEATTAVFYSISNTQKGLAGVSFGNFLIKQVAEDLKRELPGLDTFVTLSPVPGFARWLAGIAQELTDPAGLTRRVLPPILYGAGNPYAKGRGSGDARAVAALTRADLAAFRQAWLRPDKAKIFVVSDRPLAEVKAVLDHAFGDWRMDGAGGEKLFREDRSLPAARIILIDRPDSPQSLVTGGLRTGLRGTDDLLPAITMNDALGGDFLGRLNMDLREDKHWSYGVSGNFMRNAFAAPYVISAPVQADKTGASIAALRADLSAFVTTKPLTQGEFDRTIADATRSLAGNFETSGAVLGAMQANDLYRRPDDYYVTITQKYRALTRDELDATAKRVIAPDRFVWVVAGDAKIVRPQLDSLGLPVEVITATSITDAKQESANGR